MDKIKRGDTVYVIKGKDKGKSGKILSFVNDKQHALVEGINLVKKHMRRRSQEQQAGIVSIESPISVGNILLFCKRCDRPARAGFTLLKDGTKTRICRKCKEVI